MLRRGGGGGGRVVLFVFRLFAFDDDVVLDFCYFEARSFSLFIVYSVTIQMICDLTVVAANGIL